MANLQQCLLQGSIKPITRRRRRRKRNKGKKIISSLNNTFIYEYCLQRNNTGPNVNNLITLAPPEESALKPTNQNIAVNQTIDLCSDDNSNETINDTYNGNDKPCVISQQKEDLIDLSEDVPDEDEVIILSNDESKSSESESPCLMPHENKSDTQSHNLKSPSSTPANNRPKSVFLYTKSEDKSPRSKSPDNQLPNFTSLNAKPSTSKAFQNLLVHSKPEDKSAFKKPPDTQSLNSKSSNATPAANTPSKCVLHSKSEDKSPLRKSPDNQPPNSKSFNAKPSTSKALQNVQNGAKNNSPLSKPPDTEPPNSNSYNSKPASNRPCKSVLIHSRSEDESPLSEPPKRKHCCTTHHEYKQPQAKPANTSSTINEPKTVVIDISDDESAGESDGNPNLDDINDTNDEVLVIGTFNNTSEPNVVPSNEVPKSSSTKLSQDPPRKPRKEQSRDRHTECHCEDPKELPKSHSKARSKENPTQGSSKTVRRQGDPNIAEPSGVNLSADIVKLRRRIKAKYFKKMLQYKKKMEVDLFDTMKYQHLLINNTLTGTELANGVGGNVYINSPVYIPSSGLRPIMIDGSNVAFTSENQYKFSCKRLDICIKYFKEKGHKVTAFVPQFRVQSHQSDNPGLLDQLVRSGDVVLTPSKVIDGKLIVPYDDRFIVQAAVLKGGVIISRDNYKDLLEENPNWAETIKYRTLAYTWVDDVLMFPSDPLGVVGPSLEEFLRFN